MLLHVKAGYSSFWECCAYQHFATLQQRCISNLGMLSSRKACTAVDVSTADRKQSKDSTKCKQHMHQAVLGTAGATASNG
jgi:hypothetical protein